MPLQSEDTIYALSSGRLPAAIAIVRISGSKARIGLETLGGKVPEPRRAVRGIFRDPSSGAVIDDGLVLWFVGPASETGEDVAELHLHGGRAVVAAVFRVLGTLDGFRPAEAGEFTRRALLNGKLDLTAVEGLGDLVAAETEAQRRQAMAQFRGALSAKVEAWRARLVEVMARLEAGIDFSDEGDVPGDLLRPAVGIARELASEIRAVLADAPRGERLREGFVVAIAGPPNVGKSTLLNRLAERDVAIVSAIPGTTRDAIEVALDLKGVPVVLVDTAGVRETRDPIELEGVKRALARAASADLVLWLTEAGGPSPAPPATAKTIIVRTKTDLVADCLWGKHPMVPAWDGELNPHLDSSHRQPSLIEAILCHSLPAWNCRSNVVVENSLQRAPVAFPTRHCASLWWIKMQPSVSAMRGS